MVQKDQYCSLPFLCQSIVSCPTAANNNHSTRQEIRITYVEKHSKKNQNSLFIQITLFSTKDSIEGLGCIARNWAFHDILGSSSESSFSFSVLPENHKGIKGKSSWYLVKCKKNITFKRNNKHFLVSHTNNIEN